ncbi:D-tyrosyl-tRNA(Tyr) deacylase [Planctopirus limnophila DSM 3776]|uniref:D-aminoacyl-tRNA deacylase n=1 Tax=Planctopirus limnophila (strain ATCC 43296 / DSM 3776 / IFAM 1008 / Mu 290) TaxID=521674 RepID=D5SMU4_PLAL2|nr:D-aminoacyl-tRNA deacylase [Planctopirus limnophila]ADG67999.1 D-tyrosyl-tRNA(Tyr) deacylase [Planctopirus limnophila DSM 3776]
MRAVVQRVTEARVKVAGKIVGEIGRGLMVLIGVSTRDTEADAEWLADKLVGLRIFEDEDGKMNLACTEIGGSVLAVSQFTLLGDARQGRRPSFTMAARPELAEPLYEQVVSILRDRGLNVQTGQFRTEMKVELINDGPVTMLLDSQKLF